MGLLLLPFRAVDTAGDPMSGAKLKFFAAGTSTPKSSYPTEADAVADTNGATTVTADANGLFEAVYGDNDADYKIRLTDSADSQIWEEDDVPVVRPTVSARVVQGFRSPLDYGGIGDGAQDETTAVQAAIDAAESDGTFVVDLLGLTWRCDSQLTLHAGFKFCNGNLDLSNYTGDAAIKIQGSIGSSVAWSTNVVVGETTETTADTTGVANDGWLALSSALDWDASGNDAGYMMQVRSFVANTSITFHGRTPIQLPTANSANYRPITSLDNVLLEDLVITGNTTNGKSTILIDMAENITVRRCQFLNVPGFGVDVRLSANVLIEECLFTNGQATTSHGVAIREMSRFVTVRDCTMTNLDYGISVADKPSTDLEGVTMDVTLDHNRIIGATVAGIYVHRQSYQINVTNNQIEGYDGTQTDYGIYYETFAGEISGNRIYRTVDVGLYAVCQCGSGTTQSNENLVIAKNVVDDCESTTAAIQIGEGTGQAYVAFIYDNTIQDSAGAGFLLSGGFNFNLHNNHVQTCALQCVDATGWSSSGHSSIQNNHFFQGDAVSHACIAIDGVSTGCSAIISGNYCIRGDTSTDAVIEINETATKGHFVIYGNHLEQGDYGIQVGTTEAAQHFGNTFLSQGAGNVNGTFTAARASGRDGAGNVTADGTIELDLT